MEACRTNRIDRYRFARYVVCLVIMANWSGTIDCPLGISKLLTGCLDRLAVAQETRVSNDSVSGKSVVSSSYHLVNSLPNSGQFEAGVYRTRNFQVAAPSNSLAQAVGDHAEHFRASLSEQWLGGTLPDWELPCPIQVVVSHQAHGETSFLLPEDGQSPPRDWDMKIFWPTDRLLDSVLPHEVTHTVFATYFRQRLPRWADEGACTTIEHPSEREKIQALLLRFLSPQHRQGLPFNRMFPMRDYPADMLPLYAQGYSVAKFLIAQRGHREFVSLIERGLAYETSLPATVAWDRAMRDTYGYQDLSDLQLDWLQWVADGSQEEMALARAVQRQAAMQSGEIRLAAGIATDEPSIGANIASSDAQSRREAIGGTQAGATPQNFYVQQMRTSHASSQSLDSHPAAPLDNRSTMEPIQPLLPNAPNESANRSDSTILMPQRLR